MLVVLLGPPGSGRSTQGAMLENHWGLIHLSTSHLLRREMGLGSAFGVKAMGYIAEGKLVPDELVYQIVARYLEKVPPGKDVVLNGFPRTVMQVEAFKNFLDEHGMSITHAVELRMDREEIQRRVGGRRVCTQCAFVYHVAYKPPYVENHCDSCGQGLEIRPDDTPEVLGNKYLAYEKLRGPLVEKLQTIGKFTQIDSNGAVEVVHRRISEWLGLKEANGVDADPLQKLLSTGILIHCAGCKKIVHATHQELKEFHESDVPIPVSTTMPDQRLFGFLSEKTGKAVHVGERRKRSG